MNRRNLLRALAATPAAVLLTRCAGQSVPQYVAAIEAVAQEVAASLPAMQAAGLSASASATAASAVAQILKAASAVSAASTVAQGKDALTQIETYINTLAPLALPFAAAVPGLCIAIAALPAIELLVNFGASLLNQPAQALAATAPVPPATATVGAAALPPDRARDALAELLRRAGR